MLPGNVIQRYFTYQKQNLFLLESQDIALDGLMNKCYIKGATEL